MVGRAAFRIALCVFACALCGGLSSAVAEEDPRWRAERFEGLELRSIGPALMSGRIADIAREIDLVAASFGRGFYVLDDFSALREVSKETARPPTPSRPGRTPARR